VRKRLWQGLGANAYGTLVVIIVQLAGVPILLHVWGVTLYGEWLVLFAIPSYLSLANLGYSLALANDMTTRVAHGDREGALVAYQSLLVLVSATGTVTALLLLPLLYLFPLAGWLHMTVLAPAEAHLVLLFLAGQVLIQLFGGVSSAGFRASGEYGLGVALASTVSLAQYGALWASAGAGFGPVGAAAAFFAVRVVGEGVTLGYLSYRHSWLRLGVSRARLRYLRRLITPSLANLALTIANALRNQGLVIVVGVLLGPLAVVMFSVLRTLARISLRLVAIISHAIEPEIAVAEGQRGGVPLQRRLYLAGMQSSLWVSILVGIALYFSGDVLLKLWTQGRVAMDHSLFIWLLASGTVAALWHVSVSFLVALNRQTRAALAYVTSAALTVGIAFTLVFTTGRVADAGLAMLIGDALFAGYVLLAAGRMTNAPIGLLLAHMANPIGPVQRVIAGRGILERPMRKLTAFLKGLR
jgi:O-antigen/teichoic acid export membrane protein